MQFQMVTEMTNFTRNVPGAQTDRDLYLMIIKGQKLKGKEKEEKKEDMYARAVFCGFFGHPRVP